MTDPKETPIDPRETYRRLNDTVFRLYAEHRRSEAIDLITASSAELQPWRAELAHLKACLDGSLGHDVEALDTLATAQVAGSWWDPRILMDDEDLAGLRELEAFTPLVERSRAQWELANAEPDRGGDLLELPNGVPQGIVVALHGAEEDADDAIAAWCPATSHGFAVLAIRSSQRTSPLYRSWPDPQRAAAEIAEAKGLLPEQLQSVPTIAAGFSAGGRVALQWALSGNPCRVSGVIAVAPAASASTLPARASEDQLNPALIVVGADDDLSDEVVEIAGALGSGRSGRFTLDVVPGLGHAFPDDFPARLAAALGPLPGRRAKERADTQH
jgi:dienelactone hydrolase